MSPFPEGRHHSPPRQDERGSVVGGGAANLSTTVFALPDPLTVQDLWVHSDGRTDERRDSANSHGGWREGRTDGQMEGRTDKDVAGL